MISLIFFSWGILLGVDFKLLPPLLPYSTNVKNKVGATRTEVRVHWVRVEVAFHVSVLCCFYGLNNYSSTQAHFCMLFNVLSVWTEINQWSTSTALQCMLVLLYILNKSDRCLQQFPSSAPSPLLKFKKGIVAYNCSFKCLHCRKLAKISFRLWLHHVVIKKHSHCTWRKFIFLEYLSFYVQKKINCWIRSRE